MNQQRRDVEARITLRQLQGHAAKHGYDAPAFDSEHREQALAIGETLMDAVADRVGSPE